MSDQYFQLRIMPWANLKEILKIGPVVFYPYQKLTTDLIPEGEISEYLKTYFKCYVDHHDKPVDTIALCTFGPLDFRIISSEESNAIDNAVDVLIFSIIAPQINSAVTGDNNSIGPPTSDKYLLYVQNFNPKEKSIAVKTKNVTSAGWKIGEIKFPKPFGLGGFFDKPSETIIQGFNNFHETKFPSEEKERFFRALEWFRFAHAESTSDLSKIVMMATAFEILLDLPESYEKKKIFTQKIETACKFDESLTETRDGFTKTKIAWWAWDFYNLRNSIVHGDKINFSDIRYSSPNVKWLNHLIVADLVFYELIKRELFTKKLIGKDLIDFYKAAAPNIPEEALNTYDFALSFGYRDTHQALGWLPVT